jgi:hypothetical protein
MGVMATPPKITDQVVVEALVLLGLRGLQMAGLAVLELLRLFLDHQ